MSTPQKKKQEQLLYANHLASSRFTTTPPASQTAIPSQGLRTSSISSTADTPSSASSCSAAYFCGQKDLELKQRIEKLEQRLSEVEETSAEKKSYFKKAESLLLVFKVVLILIPIVLFAALATVQYFIYKESLLLNGITSVVGLVTVVECIALPSLWKSVDSRLSKVEEQLKK